MSNAPGLSLAEVERETERFLEPATEKERAILAAAAALFGERGVEGSATAEIAKRAGVTERTLFRYFPSKSDLARRVLSPVILRTILMREWQPFAALDDGEAAAAQEDPAFVRERFPGLTTDPALARALFGELTRNPALRKNVAWLWYRHFWKPMLATVARLKAQGALREDIDLESLVWAIDCLNIGYLFLRNVHAADRTWDDADELRKMADILVRGSASDAARAACKPADAHRAANGAVRPARRTRQDPVKR